MAFDKEKFKNNLPFNFILFSAALGLGVLALTSSDEASFEPHKPAEVTEIELEPRLIDDFYINAQYMGERIPAHITLEQCNIEEPSECAEITVNLNSIIPDALPEIIIGSTVILTEIQI